VVRLRKSARGVVEPQYKTETNACVPHKENREKCVADSDQRMRHGMWQVTQDEASICVVEETVVSAL
jgi:hypothetical protein